jgi:hypothetical protein
MKMITISQWSWFFERLDRQEKHSEDKHDMNVGIKQDAIVLKSQFET